MPVLGCVLHLSTEPDPRRRSLAWLAAEPRILLGEEDANRLPAVLDTLDRGEDRALWAAISALPGVTHIDLVSADFSDLSSPPPQEDAP